MAHSDPAVEAILASVGLESLAERFAAEDIDATLLWSLRDGDLREMGLTLGQRKKLLQRLTSTPATTAVPAEPELRRLSVLFIDLVGYTQMTARLDPDDMRAILLAYYGAARNAARIFGGFIASLQGDGVVMLFGFPTTQGGSADRAMGAAHALLADLQAMARQWGNVGEIAARIGIASGRAIVGYPEDANGGEPQMVGPVINRAARLQGIASPGTVVVDDPTRALATGAFTFTRLPDADLKGFDQKVPVSQVMARTTSAPAAASATIRSAHAAEADALSRAWQEVATLTALALLSGEAGIGKSTLLHQVTAQVAGNGARVLRLACTALSAHAPLRPVVELLERMLGDATESAPAIRLDALRQLLAPASSSEIGAVAELLGLMRRPPGSMTTPDEDRRLLFGVLTRFLVGTGPCLITVEDLHWADASTRDLLRACALAAPARGLMVLATSRDAADPIWHDHPGSLHLPLAALDQTAAGQVLSHHLGGRFLPEPVVQAILSRSDGNPLMLEALARTAEGWQDAGQGQDVQVPASIYESISARIEALQAARKTAAALAVFDAPTDAATLAQALGVKPADLDDAVAELVAAGVCESADGTLRFRHTLYREVCYERLVKSVRERLHLAAFAALTERVPDITTVRPGHLAWHAFAGGDHARAAPLSLAAGEQAMQRSARIEAGHLLRQAKASLDSVQRTRATDQLRLRVLVAQASVSRGRLGIAADEVGVLGRQVLDLARDLGDSRSEMIALSGLYAHALVRADYAGASEWAERLTETAMASQDPTFGMIGTRGRGVVAFHTGALEQGADLLHQALDSYDEARHAPLAHVHGYDHAEICSAFLSINLWLMGDPAGAEKASAFSVSHSRRIGHVHSLVQALMFRGMLKCLAGDGAAALTAAQEAHDLSGRHGLGTFRGASGFFIEAATLMVRTGAPAGEELASLRQRHAEFKLANPWNYGPLTGALMAGLHLVGGDLAMAAQVLDQAETVESRTAETFARPELMRVRAQLQAAQGDTTTAKAGLQAALEDAQAMGAWMQALRIACDLAEAAPSLLALERVLQVRGRLVSDDQGPDLIRAQALLQSAGMA